MELRNGEVTLKGFIGFRAKRLSLRLELVTIYG